MNLKLIWKAFGLIQKIKEIPKGTITGLGWKTITGSVLAGLGFAVKVLSSVSGELSLDVVGNGLIGLGVIVGGIGVRDAIRKILQLNLTLSGSMESPLTENRGVKIE